MRTHHYRNVCAEIDASFAFFVGQSIVHNCQKKPTFHSTRVLLLFLPIVYYKGKMVLGEKKVEYLVVDTTAFIQNAPLQNIAQNACTIKEVVDEITSKRQLKRLCILPYDLQVKNVDPESVAIVTAFAKKTGDYPSLSATDIKVMALAYQLEKEMIGAEHLRQEPVCPKTVDIMKDKPKDLHANIVGFVAPKHTKEIQSRSNSESESQEAMNESEEQEAQEITNVDVQKKLAENFGKIDLETVEGLIAGSDVNADDILVPTQGDNSIESSESEDETGSSDGDDIGWITPSNVREAKKQVDSGCLEDKSVKVACITTDFAMQNVLKQMNLNVAALDGRMIKYLRTYILRCYACFKTTSIMTSKFCPKCGNATLKKVSVSVDSEGKQVIHINARRPLTARGKKFSLPAAQGGKHSNNPMLAADQPVPQQRASRLAKTKNNPLDDDYIAGYSPFVPRDLYSKSAMLGIRNEQREVKYWMRKNPNQSRRGRK